MTTTTGAPVTRLTTAAVVIGELCALILLAPLEFRTGLYVGLPVWTAWTITGVVYSVAALSIATGRALPAALGLVWLSGVVGALHSAAEQAAAEHDAAVRAAALGGLPMPEAGPALDAARAWTSVAVVTLVVLAMALAWWLGREAHARRAAAEQAAEEAEKARRAAAVERAERDRAAAREHELEVARLAQEAADRAALRARMAAQDAAEREAAEARAAEEQRAAEHARRLEVLRAHETAAERSRGARAEAPQRAAKTARRTTRKGAAERAQTPDELRRRGEAKEAALAALRRGEDVDAGAHACAYFGTAEPTEQQRNTARANLSTWRRKVAQEQAQDQAEGGPAEVAR